MNRNELLNMIDNGTLYVRTFLCDSDISSCLPGSYDNWNNKDTVGHIIGWMNYSIDKLSCIKLGTKQSDEYAQVTSLSEINQILYNKRKGKNKEEIESEYINAIGDYIKVISLFSNKDINLTTFETGFKMELWKYMLMDTVIHPLQHVLYQHLKNSEFNKISTIIVNTKEIFEQYSVDSNGYKLSEFEIERDEYQKKLKGISIEYSRNKEMQEFVQANIIENA